MKQKPEAERLSRLCDIALAQYRTRILDNIDLERVGDINARASVISRALMERRDARAYVMGRRIQELLAPNRAETSYVAGGTALNRDWPHWPLCSDDLDIFQDTDEEVGPAAQRDIATLLGSGFEVAVEIETFGLVEVRVFGSGEETLIQWMSETKRRFYPLVQDDEWGARLHQNDLAINKVLAASTRRQARDFADIVSIVEHLCPLGPWSRRPQANRRTSHPSGP